MSNSATGVGPAALAALTQGAAIRVVNFHDMPAWRAEAYEREFAAWARHFTACTDHDVIEFIRSGVWPKEAPALIPVLFDGNRTTYDVGLPLVERFGFTAWFMVPTAFPTVPVAEQRSFAATHRIHGRRPVGMPPSSAHAEVPDGLVDPERCRIAMTWQEIRDADARGHVVASHTRHHAPLTWTTPEATLRDEIVGSQEELERHLGRRSTTLVWRGGSAYGNDPRADRFVREAGYRLVFGDYELQLVPDGVPSDDP